MLEETVFAEGQSVRPMVFDLQWAGSGAWIAASTHLGGLWLIGAPGGTILTRADHSHWAQLWSVSVSPDDLRIATGGRDGVVRIWTLHHVGGTTHTHSPQENPMVRW
jgi:WD40 repeat protein